MKNQLSNIEVLDYNEMNMVYGGDGEGNDGHIIW